MIVSKAAKYPGLDKIQNNPEHPYVIMRNTFVYPSGKREYEYYVAHRDDPDRAIFKRKTKKRVAAKCANMNEIHSIGYFRGIKEKEALLKRISELEAENSELRNGTDTFRV